MNIFWLIGGIVILAICIYLIAVKMSGDYLFLIVFGIIAAALFTGMAYLIKIDWEQR